MFNIGLLVWMILHNWEQLFIRWNRLDESVIWINPIRWMLYESNTVCAMSAIRCVRGQIIKWEIRYSLSINNISLHASFVRLTRNCVKLIFAVREVFAQSDPGEIERIMWAYNGNKKRGPSNRLYQCIDQTEKQKKNIWIQKYIKNRSTVCGIATRASYRLVVHIFGIWSIFCWSESVRNEEHSASFYSELESTFLFKYSLLSVRKLLIF